jgi:hypothetical protein
VLLAAAAWGRQSQRLHALLLSPGLLAHTHTHLPSAAAHAQRTQHNTTQHTTQHNTTQHNTTQHNTTQHNTTQHNTTQHSTTQHNTTQHNTTQHNTPQVIGLAAGEPDFDTPAAIVDAGVAALRGGLTRYTPNTGTAALRAAIANKLQGELGVRCRAHSHTRVRSPRRAARPRVCRAPARVPRARRWSHSTPRPGAAPHHTTA